MWFPRTRGDRPSIDGGQPSPVLVPPLRFSKRIHFQYTIALPFRSTPKRKPTKRKSKPAKPKRVKHSRQPATPEELELRRQRRREYEKNRNQRPERKQYAREREKNKRQRAKELGLCCTCSQPAISSQTRCPSCAAKHRRGNAIITSNRRAAKSEDQHNRFEP